MTDTALECEITNTNAEPLAAIKVGIIDNEGFVRAVITMEEQIAKNSSIHNCGGFGEVDYDLTISNTGKLLDRIAHWKREQQHTTEKGDKT
jgi:hypothetical protein